jgi:hypothetical protein
MYAIFLNTLYRVGFKKLAIYIADFLMSHPSHPLKSRDYAAMDLAQEQTVYPFCIYCYWPVLPNRPHEYCEHELTHYTCDNCGEEIYVLDLIKRPHTCDWVEDWEIFAGEEKARMADEARMLKEEDAAMEAYFAEQEAKAQREIAEAEEASRLEDDEPDFDDQDEECPGGCGQTEQTCTCAEFASWKRYCATPLEERDGPWMA